MPQFTYSIISAGASTPVMPEQANSLLKSMQDRPAWDEIQIVSKEAQFPLLLLSWHLSSGYVLQCFETPESNSDFLSQQRALSDPSVYLELGGQTQELWPKELFVPIELAAMALEHFLAYGCQKPNLTWLGVSAFPRRTVRPRSRK